MADGRSRRRLRRRGPAGRRPHPAGHRVHREGEEGPRRPRHHPCARGPYRRARRSLATPRRAGLCDPLRRGPRRDAPARRTRRAENSNQGRRPGRAARHRPVQRRIHRGRAFDSRKLRPGDPHAGRPRRPFRRLEDRRDADGRLADRRAPFQGAGRRRRSRAHLRFDQRPARGREPFGSRCREEPFGPGRQGEGPRRHHHLRLQRSAPAGGGGSRTSPTAAR